MPSWSSRRRRQRSATRTVRSCSNWTIVKFRPVGARSPLTSSRRKYFRKAGVPSEVKRVKEKGVPEFLWRSVPAKDATFGGETSAKQVFDRLAGAWTYWGWKGGYFTTEDDARAYFDEMRYMLATQRAAPNSPQWFNTGLHWAYGIDGPAQGHYYVDYQTGELTKSTSSYEHPQPHACFIQSVDDDLVNEGGIMDLWVREARLFKYGSGTGTNFSSLRGEGEALSGGGKSSGLMGFLKIGDRAAGAIKSGGTTRRAAKMVIVDADHPDIEEFINWKVIEEQKVASIVAGLQDARTLPERDLRGDQIMGRHRRLPPMTPRRTTHWPQPSKTPNGPRSPRLTSSACWTTPSRATPASNSRPTTPIGIPRPIRPSPARTPTTRSA